MWAPQSRAFLYLSWVFWLIYQISFKRKNHLDRSPGQLHQCQNSDRLGPGKYVTLFSQLTSPIWFRISSISGSTDLCQHSSAWTTLQPWEIQIISDVRLVRPAPFPSPGHREPSQCLEGQPFTYNLVFTFCCKQFYAEAQTIVCLEHNGGGDQPEQPLSCQVVRLPRRIGMGSRGQASRPSSRPGFRFKGWWQWRRWGWQWRWRYAFSSVGVGINMYEAKRPMASSGSSEENIGRLRMGVIVMWEDCDVGGGRLCRWE